MVALLAAMALVAPVTEKTAARAAGMAAKATVRKRVRTVIGAARRLGDIGTVVITVDGDILTYDALYVPRRLSDQADGGKHPSSTHCIRPAPTGWVATPPPPNTSFIGKDARRPGRSCLPAVTILYPCCRSGHHSGHLWRLAGARPPVRGA
ncbi:protein of unknown function [Azospirillum lipoferum 4B]|uniref:Uncharacterized protein n=1 Tax=Azospirillum lipoferum (strain 4B) TaxID=862719 RepID=G7Z792_AZOL4|nr:protein of unknown function [Azospirillum lipoferum 4B]